MHAVLAEIDFAKFLSQWLPSLEQRQAAQAVSAEAERLSDSIAELVRRHATFALAGSDRAGSCRADRDAAAFSGVARAAGIASAKEVYRELEFLLPWPPEGPRAGGRYLQGFVDCLYCDAGGRWRVVDYKTNRVARERIGTAASAYEMQMLVYALAVERILKCPPAELALCFLAPVLSITSPGTTPPGDACWNWSIRRFSKS